VKNWFYVRELSIKLLLGAIAGILAALAEFKPDLVYYRKCLLELAAAGYAGSDFISGIMSKWQSK